VQQGSSMATESSLRRAWPALISSVRLAAMKVVSWKFSSISNPPQSMEASRIPSGILSANVVAGDGQMWLQCPLLHLN
jgi:hypothetical protein